MARSRTSSVWDEHFISCLAHSCHTGQHSCAQKPAQALFHFNQVLACVSKMSLSENRKLHTLLHFFSTIGIKL